MGRDISGTKGLQLNLISVDSGIKELLFPSWEWKFPLFVVIQYWIWPTVRYSGKLGNLVARPRTSPCASLAPRIPFPLLVKAIRTASKDKKYPEWLRDWLNVRYVHIHLQILEPVNQALSKVLGTHLSGFLFYFIRWLFIYSCWNIMSAICFKKLLERGINASLDLCWNQPRIGERTWERGSVGLYKCTVWQGPWLRDMRML